MLLLSHIIIALAGMAITAVSYIAPTKAKLSTAYALAGLTLATGTLLTILNPSHLAQACMVGLIYFGIVGALIAATRAKLAAETIHTRQD